MHIRFVTGVGVAVASIFLLAGGTAAQAAPNTCEAAEHAQFDFWVGEWQVTNPQGGAAGTNRIEKVLNGCALHESWVGASGNVGHSYNAYDRSRGVWHQTWVDNAGQILQLDGSFDAGRMVLQGETVRADGQAVLHRITWSVMDGDPDRVRQLWESSGDGGETWSVAFDGRYLRVDK